LVFGIFRFYYLDGLKSYSFITQFVKTRRYFVETLSSSYRVRTHDRKKKRKRNKRIECCTHSKPTVNPRSPYWRHVRDSRRASPWKRSHPGGGLYSNRAGESRPRRGATSSRNKYVSPVRVSCIRGDEPIPAATNTSATN